MIFAGIDIGSRTSKAVLLQNNSIISKTLADVSHGPEKSAENVLTLACKAAKIEKKSLKALCSTGYGRESVSSSSFHVSEISCHGKGVSWFDNSIRTVIDIGGQDCKVLSINADGFVEDFRMNAKCAAGTGVSIEILADMLEISVEELSRLAIKSKRAVPLTSKCTLYLELEVLSWLFQGKKLKPLARGITNAIATQIVQLIRSLPSAPPIAITGGVAKNKAVVKEIERQLQQVITPLPCDPQFIGAVGAALFALEGNQVS